MRRARRTLNAVNTSTICTSAMPSHTSDVPVQVQGVRVRPGEWLYADADGIVVLDRPA